MARFLAMVAGCLTGSGIGEVLFEGNYKAGFFLLLVGLPLLVVSAVCAMEKMP